MSFDSLQTIFLIFSFLVPGFIFDSAFSMLIPKKQQAWEHSLLYYFTFSCLNYALCSWLVYLIINSDFFIEHISWSAIGWLFIILISPFALGIVLGWLAQKDNVRKYLENIGLRFMHPIPNSWDYFFGNTTPKWILVTLKDGHSVAGYFGEKSFAASDLSGRDLYIEKIYRVKENEPWEAIADSAGTWLPGELIKHIEFWNITNGGNNERRKKQQTN